jgi:hypothetical protein
MDELPTGLVINKTKNCVRSLRKRFGTFDTPPQLYVPTSSSSMASSSNSMYREKSFFKTRNKIMVKNAVNKRTRTQELMMESQWISNELGRKPDSV